MIKLESAVTERISKLYEQCNALDLEANNAGRTFGQYEAAFADYQGFYEPMRREGIDIVDPATVGFAPARKAECSAFAIFLLKLGLPIQAFNDMSSLLPRIETPEENAIILYNWQTVGGHGGKPWHVGVWRDGKVLSKFGHGPIFTHPPERAPYNSSRWTGAAAADYVTFHKVPLL